jgi:HD-like signal output (HDOD) protein
MNAPAQAMSEQHATSHSDGNDVAFTFVQALAAELSGGKVELPGFPHIVMRVQKVLADENADAPRIVRVIGSEPVLATQLVRMANSAALNPSGTAVMDLRTAVARCGLDTVRSATIAFAIQQLRHAPSLKGLEKQLGVLWRRGVQVASLSHAVAKRLTGAAVSPDAAMLAGLLQGIGRLYILTRASRYPSLFADPLTYQTIEHDWHLSIAAALLENWGMADDIVQAVHDSENFDREPRGTPALADVLVVAGILADLQGEPEVLKAQTECSKPLQRLHLDYEACEVFLKESAAEIAALRDALG